MRLRLVLAGAAVVAVAATGVVYATSNSDKPSNTSAGQHAAATHKIDAELPAWSTDAPGAYKGQIKMPADAKVIETLTGDNAGKPLDQPTTYKLRNSGNGMQVRFACNKTLLPDGVYYFSPKIGTLDAQGSPDYYEDAPSDATTGSFFFNWDWLSNKIGQPGSKGFISPYGDCKWEIRILSFPQQPLPGE